MKTLLLILTILFWNIARAEEYPARVIRISDGDTVTVLRDGQEQIRVRLARIDAPESRQPFGKKATQALSGKIFGKTIRVEVSSIDRWGRTIADLYLGDRWINLEMVAEGWAWHYRQFCDDTRLAEAELRARREGLGLWNGESPIAPWEWRRGKR